MFVKPRFQDGNLVNQQSFAEWIIAELKAVRDEFEALKVTITVEKQAPPPANPQTIGNFVVDKLAGTAALSTVNVSENKEDAVDEVQLKTRGKK